MIKFPLLTAALSVTLLLGGCGSESDSGEEAPATTSRQLVPVQSAAVLENYLKQSLIQPSLTVRVTDEAARRNDSELVDAAPEADISDDSNFSNTNTQEQGVDEADLVKYDGEYLYVAKNTANYCCWAWDTLVDPVVVRAEDSLIEADERLADPYPEEEFSEIRILTTADQPPTALEVNSLSLSLPASQIQGLYLHQADSSPDTDSSNAAEKSLVAIASGYDSVATDYQFDYWGWYASRTNLHFFNVTDPSVASETHSLQIQGQLVSSRVVAGKLHLVTRFTPYIRGYIPPYDDETVSDSSQQQITDTPLVDLLPKRKLDDQEVELLVQPDHCFVPSYEENNNYPTLITISTIDLADPSQMQSVCVAGYNDNIYATTESLYLIQQNYQSTRLHQFDFTADGPEFVASGEVKGNLGWRNVPFRLGAKDGLLRVVTSLDRVHHLYQLASDKASGTLSVVSQLPNDSRPEAIGEPGDGIDAVRFVGDRLYVATSLQVDPLYVINLENPQDPFIAGSVKLPGFSNYLHPINQNLLLGVGMETDASERFVREQGVKVVLFDITDPTAPSVSDAIILGNSGSSTPLLQDHKAFATLPMADGTIRFTIPVSIHQTDPGYEDFWYYNWSYNALALFELDTNSSEMALVGEVQSMTNDDPSYQYWSRQQRGVLHDDQVHFVDADQVWSADWNYPKDVVGPQ